MCFNLKILILLGLISSSWASANVVVTNSSTHAHFSGLLSDVLETNRQHDLKITFLCNEELNSIQNGLDVKEIWAIKRKYIINSKNDIQN